MKILITVTGLYGDGSPMHLAETRICEEIGESLTKFLREISSSARIFKVEVTTLTERP